MLASTRMNLSKASALVIDDNPQARELICSVLVGFGMREIVRCESAAEAMELCQRQTFDLILTDGQMPGMDGYDFVRWLRREAGEQARLTPAVVITAHTRRSHVERARDCGANFIVAKPISPKVILERIFWVAQSSRMFVETDTYIGPDRRFQQLGPPAEFPDGRRRDDMTAAIGSAGGDNMSQEELNSIIAPQKASL
jgi:CheY-like chemotaxis protein